MLSIVTTVVVTVETIQSCLKVKLQQDEAGKKMGKGSMYATVLMAELL